jgi:flagellar biosynthesis protein FlhA
LIATLFRLSLNVATTRLILSDANAGKVISAIGAYVVGGNYVIGLIVFLILVVVQYVVVTSGAQRVSEVAARFTLDSLPGQQMSIDADLNMGFITQEEAKRRRKLLEKETGFYGAMDGASKFVKGDAIAGIIIMLINIVGGLVIGVMQMGMPWSEALHTFTLLTVGDGIVTQVPALVISVGTGIIVTRSSSDANLSDEVLRQITSFPKTMQIVVGALVIIMFLPGIPAFPVALIALLLAVAGTVARRRSQAEQISAANRDVTSDDQLTKNPIEENPYDLLHVEAIEVMIGSSLRGLVKGDNGLLMERIRKMRMHFAAEHGLVLPAVRFRDGQLLASNAYDINLHGVKQGRGELVVERLMAIPSNSKSVFAKGIPAKEPSFGLPALWILPTDREAARAAGQTVVDPLTVFTTHLQEVCKRHAAMLLTRAETDKLLQGLRDRQPGLVEELIPTMLSISEVQKVLQELLRESVSIKNLEAIIEALIDSARTSKDVNHLVASVRLKLGAAICQSIVGDNPTLTVVTLHPQTELLFAQGLHADADSGALSLSPRFTESLLRQLMEQVQKMSAERHPPVVLCASPIRRHLRNLVERPLPTLRILSMNELPKSINLQSYAVINVDGELVPGATATA